MTESKNGEGSGTGAGRWPDADELAALRAWLQGLGTRGAVDRYLAHRRTSGQSARSMLGELKRRVESFARSRGRDDLAEIVRTAHPERPASAQAALEALDVLPRMPTAAASPDDPLERWLPPRVSQALRAHGLQTMADVVLRSAGRRTWWHAVAGLGPAGARAIDGFLRAHPGMAHRAHELVLAGQARSNALAVVPWERFAVPALVDGSQGVFRAPRQTCALDADDDHAAVQAWLGLHESPATQRAYRKEAERLILWAVIERGRALSSLTTEDAVAYRAFLRHPMPRERWVARAQDRNSPQWRPFAGDLSPRSVAYALAVLNAMFRWLIEKRYVLANPFAGVNVRGARGRDLDNRRAFSAAEWDLIRTMADGLEWSHGWSEPAARRLRLLLDLGYSTGLRVSELVGATLGDIEHGPDGVAWLNVVGKGNRAGRVVLPPMARRAIERDRLQRGLPLSPSLWVPGTPLLAPLVGPLVEPLAGNEPPPDPAGISASRLWQITRRFFRMVAASLEPDSPALADKLRRATPHWMRHTHATHLLDGGAELTTVRDNLRHASVATTSLYVHADDDRRSRQVSDRFAARD